MGVANRVRASGRRIRLPERSELILHSRGGEIAVVAGITGVDGAVKGGELLCRLLATLLDHVDGCTVRRGPRGTTVGASTLGWATGSEGEEAVHVERV